MKAVFGMLNLRGGHVKLDGEDITALSPEERVKKKAWVSCRRPITSSRR